MVSEEVEKLIDELYDDSFLWQMKIIFEDNNIHNLYCIAEKSIDEDYVKEYLRDDCDWGDIPRSDIEPELIMHKVALEDVPINERDFIPFYYGIFSELYNYYDILISDYFEKSIL